MNQRALLLLICLANPLFAQQAPVVEPVQALPSAAAPTLVVPPSIASLSPLSVAPRLAPVQAAPALKPAARPAEPSIAPLENLARPDERLRERLSSAFDGLAPRAMLSANEGGPRAAGFSDALINEARRRFRDAPILQKHSIELEGIPSAEEMTERIRRAARENEQRERDLIELFVLAGARREDIILEDIGDGRHNIGVIKRGRTDRKLYVGGHHDKVSAGWGTIDNWTGATMVVNLYQALKDVETEHTIVFMVFGREEEGLVGSRRHVERQSREELGKIDAMLNNDTLGVNGNYGWENNSDAPVLDAFSAESSASGIPFERVSFSGGDADSSSFRRRRVPATTIFGASPDIIFDIIHSENDNFGQFQLEHYKNSYFLEKRVIERLDKLAGRPGAASTASEPLAPLPHMTPWWLAHPPLPSR